MQQGTGHGQVSSRLIAVQGLPKAAREPEADMQAGSQAAWQPASQASTVSSRAHPWERPVCLLGIVPEGLGRHHRSAVGFQAAVGRVD